VITGAAQGIGAHIAATLAAEGARVGVLDQDFEGVKAVARAIEERGGRAHPVRVDVRVRSDVERAIRDVQDSLGELAIAVTCAGVVRTSPFLDLAEEDWDATLDVNLKGTFLVLQAAARQMLLSRTPGRLVSISSVAGRSGRADLADYAASKAGVISLIRSAALAFAKYGITANSVCPGVVDTAMTAAIHEQRARRADSSSEESLAEMVASIPLGRLETTGDVASAVLFLLSDEAAYITGQALNVCGGMEMD
jgi:NAD(P)-dependent dehydrogenase (short-subunit alcohol dehydrogenase family)